MERFDIVNLMRKFWVFLTAVFCFLVLTTFAHAQTPSLVVIHKDRSVTLNVLGSETDRSVSVKNVADKSIARDAKISLNIKDGKVNVDIDSSSGQVNLDVTNVETNLVEVEETPAVKKITIAHEGDSFVIIQGDQTAKTSYPIEINAQENLFSVKTPSGYQQLANLPADIVSSLVKLKILDFTDGPLTISTGERGELVYDIHGARDIKLFNLIDISPKVEARVSAATGGIISTQKPTWYRILGFLFE